MELYVPQEERLLVGAKKQSMGFGVPKESIWNENRIPLTPEGVDMLVSRGHRVVVQAGAGEAARYSDTAYSEAGAHIVPSASEAFASEFIVKVQPPTLEELSWMRPGATLFSALQPHAIPKEYLPALLLKNCTALSYEELRDEHGQTPYVRSMGEIAGSTAIVLAADYLSTTMNGRGFVMGGVTGVPPTEVVILGAGIVGTVAARVARGMGAHVKVFDSSLTRLQRLQNQLGQGVFTVAMQPRVLQGALEKCDVVIGALRSVNGRTPCVVSSAMVARMKPGSIIVDVSIDQGGCFETSEITTWQSPVFERFGVLHIGIPNMAARTARTASFALNTITAPLLDFVAVAGGVEEAAKNNPGIRAGIYSLNGTLTHKSLGDRFDLPYTDTDLLLS